MNWFLNRVQFLQVSSKNEYHKDAGEGGALTKTFPHEMGSGFGEPGGGGTPQPKILTGVFCFTYDSCVLKGTGLFREFLLVVDPTPTLASLKVSYQHFH